MDARGDAFFNENGFGMTVVSHPAPGTIVRVDLSEGFRVPEMGKRRPAIVLSPPIPKRPLMCTIVPLSTRPPGTVLRHHMAIAFDPPLPHPYDAPIGLVKGDIILTVAFHRLRLLFSGPSTVGGCMMSGFWTLRRSPGCRTACALAWDSDLKPEGFWPS
jgi:uncharacterized protein YifN (PemK superfamily)